MIQILTPPHPFWKWASLIGPDAKDFLHRLTTVDVRSLSSGPPERGARGCFLTPQGKIRAFFTLWNYGPDEFAFEFDAGPDGRWRDLLFTTIDQYTFAEKMVLADVVGLECRWIFGEDAAMALGISADQTLAMEGNVRVCHHGSSDYGRTWLTAWGRQDELEAWMKSRLPGAAAVGHAELENWRIQAMKPAPGREITEATIPLEVGMVDFIATGKGCYPGQEVIEKIISLGAPARRLALIEGSGKAPAAGEKVFNEAAPPVEVGEITSVSESESGNYLALAIVRKLHAKEGLKVTFSDNGTTQAEIRRLAPYTPA